MKKILLIHTGGTIGSHIKEGIIHVVENTENYLIQLLRLNDSNLSELEIISPFRILSENISLEKYNRLFEMIHQVSVNQYLPAILHTGSYLLYRS